MNFKPFITVVLTLVCGGSASAESNARSLQLVNPSVQVPPTEFFDGSKLVSLDSFRGRRVVLNIWATWCSPCVKEMPSLDRLSAKMKGENLVVVALSQDKGGHSQVKPFLEKLKIKNLKVLYDHELRAMRDLRIRGLPTTLIISPEGKILARLEGSAEWDSQELINKINALHR